VGKRDGARPVVGCRLPQVIMPSGVVLLLNLAIFVETLSPVMSRHIDLFSEMVRAR